MDQYTIIIGGTGYPALLVTKAYLAIGLLVWIGFIIQRYGWGEPERRDMLGGQRALRVMVVGFICGIFWLPILAVLVLVGLFMLFAAVS